MCRTLVEAVGVWVIQDSVTNQPKFSVTWRLNQAIIYQVVHQKNVLDNYAFQSSDDESDSEEQPQKVNKVFDFIDE
jgi:hypothetical protein